MKPKSRSSTKQPSVWVVEVRWPRLKHWLVYDVLEKRGDASAACHDCNDLASPGDEYRVAEYRRITPRKRGKGKP
jgi:hypothetical protein